jgi:hypothetical protein
LSYPSISLVLKHFGPLAWRTENGFALSGDCFVALTEETKEPGAAVVECLAVNLRLSFPRGLAEQWVVSDCVEPADAIVVLGGALDIRPASSANLHKQRISPLVLVSKSEADNGREARRMRERLRASGAPSTAISDLRSSFTAPMVKLLASRSSQKSTTSNE